MKVRLNDDLENLQCPVCMEKEEEAHGLQESGPRTGLIGIEDMTALFYNHEEIPRLYQSYLAQNKIEPRMISCPGCQGWVRPSS